MTSTVDDLNHTIRKRQRSLLRQIAARDQKIAQLEHEKAQLRNELMHVSDNYAEAWCTPGQEAS